MDPIEQTPIDKIDPVPANDEAQGEMDFGDNEAAPVSGDPTVGQQAEFILQAPEGDALSDRDKAYLQQVARDMQEVVGILHRNPDGTYAPINDPNGGDRKVDSSNGQITAKPGYRLKDDSTEFAFSTEPDVKYTNANLTHEAALRIMKRDPRWSRQNMVRGWYQEEDSYWGKV